MQCCIFGGVGRGRPNRARSGGFPACRPVLTQVLARRPLGANTSDKIAIRQG
jgi:hypothetical protein